MIAACCPDCGAKMTAKEKLLGELIKCPKCSTKFRVHDPSRELGRITMQSGTEYYFDKILMFDAKKIQQAESLRDEAVRNMQHKSSGIGFIGNFTTVIAASLAVGLVEDLVSAKYSRTGFEQLASYHDMIMHIRYHGKFITLDNVDHSQLASPDLWTSIELDGDGNPSKAYTMIPEERFVTIGLLGGAPRSIQWGAVEQYWVVTPGQTWLSG